MTWKIKQFNYSDSEFHGKFYIVRYPEKDPHLYEYYSEEYLHSDGSVRLGTRSRDTGKYTGYYNSQEEAQAALWEWEHIHTHDG